MSRIVPVTAACAVISLYAMSAHAQQPAPTAAQAAVDAAATAAATAATPIPGICVFAQDAAVATSLVGQAANQRISQIGNQVNAEINGIRAQLDADGNALTAQRATMTQALFEQAATALQQRANEYQQRVEVRSQEMEQTRQAALIQIGDALSPLLIDAFNYHKCSILIDRAAVMLVAPGMDITSDAVARLDSKIQQINIDKVTLSPAQGGVAGPPAAAAPAAAVRAPAAAPARAPAARTPAAPAGRVR